MSLTSKAPLRVKVLLIGDYNVGKTTLQRVYINGRFKPPCYGRRSANSPFAIKAIQIEFEKSPQIVKVELWDTMGMERFNILPKHYFNNIDGIIFMYDINDINTLKNIYTKWIPHLIDGYQFYNHLNKKSKHKTIIESIPHLIIGNKADKLMEYPIYNLSKLNNINLYINLMKKLNLMDCLKYHFVNYFDSMNNYYLMNKIILYYCRILNIYLYNDLIKLIYGYYQSIIDDTIFYNISIKQMYLQNCNYKILDQIIKNLIIKILKRKNIQNLKLKLHKNSLQKKREIKQNVKKAWFIIVCIVGLIAILFKILV